MTRMTKGLLGVGFLLTTVLGCVDQSRETEVGVILPLTGGASVYGQAIKNGIELAYAEDSTDSRLRMFSFRYQDDQGLPQAAVSAAKTLIDIDNVPAIIGGAMSSTAEAVIPVCDSANVVLLSPTATKASLTKAGSYFLRLWPSDDYDGKVMAEAAYNRLEIRRIAIVYVNVAYGVGITEVFEREFSKLGGVVVSKEGYNQNATDFRSILGKLKASDVSAVFLPGYIAEISQLLRQMRQMDLKLRVLGVNSFYDPKLIELAGSAVEGAVFSYPTFDVNSPNAKVSRFVRNYKNRYGMYPDAFAAQGYDSYFVLREALSKMAGVEVTGENILQSMHGLGELEGVSGRFTFDAKGDVQKELRLIKIRAGKFENL